MGGTFERVSRPLFRVSSHNLWEEFAMPDREAIIKAAIEEAGLSFRTRGQMVRAETPLPVPKDQMWMDWECREAARMLQESFVGYGEVQ